MILFIHGDSYEWGSGNIYDGSVLAAVGRVVVVTLNYRLGILGMYHSNELIQKYLFRQEIRRILVFKIYESFSYIRIGQTSFNS